MNQLGSWDKIFRLATLLVSLTLWLFFSYKLTDVPPGINGDEASIGYNAALLSKTLRDENKRFLPFFILSNAGKDWHQPITEYSTAFFFRIFGVSFFNLRAVSVLIMVVSSILMFYFLNIFQGGLLAILGSAIFITTPILMIQSHLGMENIAPVPFVILWLLGILLFEKKQMPRYLILAGISLGAAFYSYKGLRLMVPIWTVLTLAYLYLTTSASQKRWKKIPYSLITLALSLLPFIIIIPLLRLKYPGAVFDGQTPSFKSYQDFFLPYLSSFDLSFLYLKGDETLYHSTGHHGALLLASLPLFLLGCFQAVKQRGLALFVLLAFLLGPLLFGFTDALHRASRLLAQIPPYTFISALGASYLWSLRSKFRKWLIPLLVLLFFLNFLDFINYYWNIYPKEALVIQAFRVRSDASYAKLAAEAKKRSLIPTIDSFLYSYDAYGAKLFEQSYFETPLKLWGMNKPIPKDSILLTDLDSVNDMEKLDLKLPLYKLYVPKRSL